MKLNRKKTRKLLLQQLFSSIYQTLNLDDFYDSFYEDQFSFTLDKKYIEELTKIIKERENFFINIIEKYSPKFSFENMNKINIIILYIAFGEMFFFSEEIPAKVSINEALELAKTYSGESSRKMINGVLNNVLKDFEDLQKIDFPKTKKSIFYNF